MKRIVRIDCRHRNTTAIERAGRINPLIRAERAQLFVPLNQDAVVQLKPAGRLIVDFNHPTQPAFARKELNVLFIKTRDRRTIDRKVSGSYRRNCPRQNLIEVTGRIIETASIGWENWMARILKAQQIEVDVVERPI